MDGEGVGLAVFRLELFLVLAFFFGVERFALGLAADGLGITCPSCCGNAVRLSVSTSAKAQSVRSFFQLLNQFITPPLSSQKVNIQLGE